jgi:hypothetical protein
MGYFTNQSKILMLDDQLKSLTGQLAYTQCKLLTLLEPWERKEFEPLKKDYELKIAGINCAKKYLNQEGGA